MTRTDRSPYSAANRIFPQKPGTKDKQLGGIMTIPHRMGGFLAFAFLVLVAGFATGQEKASKLTAEDEKFLEGLMRDFVFDPKGADRVAVPMIERSVWGSSGNTTLQGWLVKRKDGDRVYFTDGDSVPAPPVDQRAKVNFIAQCKEIYLQEPNDKRDQIDSRERFARMKRDAVGLIDIPDIVFAAWLYRLGENALAAKALSLVNDRDKAVAAARGALAWSAYAGMVHAYMVCADEEALVHGEHLLRLYAKETKNYKQAEAIVGDLKRRKEQGTLGKGKAKELAKNFEKLETKKKIEILIEALQDVDARQVGQPGGIDLASDFRVAALIQIGDPAVPALLDVLEKDGRLTRSVHFWRDFSPSRTVLSVREASLVALMSILQVRTFGPGSTGDNFTSRGEEAARKAAKELRVYWKEYGHLSRDERMMKVLINPKSRFEELRVAAENLANFGGERSFGTTVWTDSGKPRPKGINPVIAKFSKPTAAEAILAAMDRDLANHDRKKDDDLYDYRRRKLEDQYLFPLMELGDRRIAGELAKRAGAADSIRMRRKWAHAAYHLGDPEPMKKYANDFGAGKIELPGNGRDLNHFDQPGYVELRGIVMYLSDISLPEADLALYSLADKKHKSHAEAAKAVLADNLRFEETGWTSHAYCLLILRTALDDKKYQQQAVKRLKVLIGGVGPGDPVDEYKDYLDRNMDKFRRASAQRRDRLGGPPRELLFIVDPVEPAKKP